MLQFFNVILILFIGKQLSLLSMLCGKEIMLFNYFKKIIFVCIFLENEIVEVLIDIENIYVFGQEDDGDWEEVGFKNKLVVIRVVRFSGIFYVIVSILKVFLVLLIVILYLLLLIINYFIQ